MYAGVTRVPRDTISLSTCQAVLHGLSQHASPGTKALAAFAAAHKTKTLYYRVEGLDGDMAFKTWSDDKTMTLP